MKTIWKTIKGTSYSVSNTGLVKNMHGKILKLYQEEKGYLRVRFCEVYIKTNRRIHRLVAEAFIPNPDNLPQVAHIDNNKLNNNVENLKWTTNALNMAEANRDGLREVVYEKFRKLAPKEVREIRDLHGILTERQLAELYDVTHTTIGAILRRKTWKHL